MMFPPLAQRDTHHHYHPVLRLSSDGPTNNNWLDMNCYKQNIPSPFLYGLACSNPANITDQMEIASCVFLFVIVCSVVLKRQSAKPGGHIYQYNQIKVHKILTDKRHRLRDMLNDPVLVKDMERRYGDITSLRDVVHQWETDGFTLQKKESDDCIKVRGIVYVPWIRIANTCLVLTTLMTLYCNFGVLTSMILTMNLVHLVDNALLHKAAVARHNGRDWNKSEKGKVVAAVGVPVSISEVESGIPV